MKLKKVTLGMLGLGVVAGSAGWFSLDKETRDLLFWSEAQRDAAFRAMDRLPVLAKWHVVAPSATPSPLPSGPPLKLGVDVQDYMASQRSSALLIVHDGKLRLERYGLGFDAAGRWTSFSVAKSLTSTLLGAAIRNGYIGNQRRLPADCHARCDKARVRCNIFHNLRIMGTGNTEYRFRKYGIYWLKIRLLSPSISIA